MNHKSEHDCSIPALQQQVFVQWYQEWESPDDTLGNTPLQQVIKPLVRLSGIIAHIVHPVNNDETSATLHSNSESALQSRS